MAAKLKTRFSEMLGIVRLNKYIEASILHRGRYHPVDPRAMSCKASEGFRSFRSHNTRVETGRMLIREASTSFRSRNRLPGEAFPLHAKV